MTKAKVISFINMKGGVGKTTLCISVAEYLANFLEKRVLIIDVDPQFNATQSLMGNFNRVDEYMDEIVGNKKTIRELFKNITSVYEKNTDLKADEIIVELNKNLHIICGDINLIFDGESRDPSRNRRIKKFINHNNLREHYDFIFIDCPPTISFFTDSAIIASDYFIIPAKIDRYSQLGTASLMSIINRLISDEELGIKPLGIIYTMIDGLMENLTQKTKEIKELFEEEESIKGIYIFKSYMQDVTDLKVGKQGNIASKYQKSYKDIKNICEEIIEKVEEGL
ncbi:ParA family protein [Clostridium botulinum]|uniref:ParA family protein n=1 Tax=Clostridium botulinum TaxID=1491 RepID=UPI003A7F67EC